MLILNKNKKGFTIIEVMCSVAVFSIFFLTSLSIKLATDRMKIYNDEILVYTEYIEILKNEIICNITCDEVKNLSESGRVFINSENINAPVIKNSSIYNMFSSELKSGRPYIQISLTDGELQLISIRMYTKIISKNKIFSCQFYKGRE